VKIGYQDGITAFFDWYRKQPGVPQRGPKYDPDDIDTWPWPDKMERTLRILKDDHDAAVTNPTPPPVEPPVEPPPGDQRVAPMSYKKGTNDADPRYCLFSPNGALRPGIRAIGGGLYEDESGAQYNGDGLNTGNVWRNRNIAPPGLLPANNMDGRDACEPYVVDGLMIGGSAGYPEESYL
jgi:hypothetical protein